MTDEQPQGQRYSLIYLKPEELSSDSQRMRKRLAITFDELVSRDEHSDLGRALESELGISVLHDGLYDNYIRWDDLLHWETRDVLCTITLLGRYARRKSENAARRLNERIRRILIEECVGYTLDSSFGVHPAVDAAFRAELAGVLRGLEAGGYAAARSYIERADAHLLPEGDRREAVKSSFDAVENVFKILCPRAQSLNKLAIDSYLRPEIDRIYLEAVAKRAAHKMYQALTDWSDACHNYRHASGDAALDLPPEELAVALVSQGLGYVRWLVDLRRLSSDTSVE